MTYLLYAVGSVLILGGIQVIKDLFNSPSFGINPTPKTPEEFEEMFRKTWTKRLMNGYSYSHADKRWIWEPACATEKQHKFLNTICTDIPRDLNQSHMKPEMVEYLLKFYIDSFINEFA